MNELKQYLLPCPLHEGRFARDCCKYTTNTNLPDIPCNVLVDFIGCRNCQFFNGEIRTFKINIQNVENQNDFMQKFINDIKGVSVRYSINKQNIDQNGVMTVQPKFVSWSLVSQQNLVDKNCKLNNTFNVIWE